MRSLVWDTTALVGAVFISVGLGLIYLPLAMLFIGGALLLVGVWGALTVARERIAKQRDQK
jgi:hypothetical protein